MCDIKAYIEYYGRSTYIIFYEKSFVFFDRLENE